MKKVFALGILVAFLVSCNSNTTYQTIKIKNTYSLELPDFLSETKILNPEASLQYQNPLKELYVIVMDEPKTDFENAEEVRLEAYTDILRNNLESSLRNPKFSTIKDTVINGLRAKLFSLTDNTDGVEIYYQFAYIENDTDFYQILTWTLERRKTTYTKDMDRIIASFKILESKSRAK